MSLTYSICFISLLGATERRARILKEMAGRSDWFIFNASSRAPEGIHYNPEKALTNRGRTLSEGEIGCYGSHYECLKQFAAAGSTDYLIMMEDDVILDHNFNLAELCRLMKITQIDFIRLYSRVPARNRIIAQIDNRYLIRFAKRPYGTQAYVVSKTSARQFVTSVSEIIRPIDDEMDRFWHNRVPPYAIFPYPVLEIQTSTTVIKPSSFNMHMALAQRVALSKNRLSEKIRRELSNVFFYRKDYLVRRLLKNTTRYEWLQSSVVQRCTGTKAIDDDTVNSILTDLSEPL